MSVARVIGRPVSSRKLSIMSSGSKRRARRRTGARYSKRHIAERLGHVDPSNVALTVSSGRLEPLGDLRRECGHPVLASNDGPTFHEHRRPHQVTRPGSTATGRRSRPKRSSRWSRPTRQERSAGASAPERSRRESVVTSSSSRAAAWTHMRTWCGRPNKISSFRWIAASSAPGSRTSQKASTQEVARNSSVCSVPGSFEKKSSWCTGRGSGPRSSPNLAEST